MKKNEDEGAAIYAGDLSTHPKDGLRLPLDIVDFGHWLSRVLAYPPTGVTPEQYKFFNYVLWQAYRRGFFDAKLMVKRGKPLQGLPYFDQNGLLVEEGEA